LMLEQRDLPRDESRSRLDQILTVRKHFLFRHPDHVSRELVRDLRPAFRGGENVSARNIDLISKYQRRRLPCYGLVALAIGSDNFGNTRAAARISRYDLVAFGY